MTEPHEDIAVEAPVRAPRILIVDDQNSSRVMIGSILEAAGYGDLHYAADGVEAMAAIAALDPDMVILDVMMPRKDGFDVCREVRQELRHDLPILIQTGLRDPQQRVKAFEVGASDILLKPIDAGELVSRVALHLERRRMVDSLQRYRRRMQEELKAAAAMQRSLLTPPHAVDAIAVPRGAAISSMYRASNQLGGDLWQVFEVDEARLGIFMIDLSGHGVASAINAFRVNMIVPTLEAHRADPALWLETLNRELHDMLPVEHFATAFYGVLDGGSGRLDYAAAASPAPILLRSGGEWNALEGDGIILGCLEDAAYETRTVSLAPGDRVLLYSDALTENFRDPSASLSTGDVAECFAQVGDETDGATLLQSVLQRARPDAACGLSDDLTLLLVEVLP